MNYWENDERNGYIYDGRNTRVFVVVRNLVDAVFATDVSSIGSIVYSCKQLKSGSKNNQIDTMKDSDWYSC